MTPPNTPKATLAKLDQYRRQEKESAGEDGSAMCSERDVPGSDTAKVLDAITFCRTSLTAQIEEVKVDISLIRQDFQKLCKPVATA